MTVVQYEAPAPLPASGPTDELDAGPVGWVARLRAAAEIANYIGSTEFVPQQLRDNPPAIAAAILYGQEVGLEPMQALAKIAVIKGKPSLTAEAQRALILSAGHEIWLEDSTITRCIAAARRRDNPRIGRVTWTLDDAKRAGLAGQPNFRSYPREMLVARATAALARVMFADVIGGLPATEELDDGAESAPSTGEFADRPAGVDEPKPAARTRRRARAADTDPPAAAAEPAAPPPEPEPARPPVTPTPPPDTQPEPPPPGPGEQPPSTGAQRRQIFALFRDVGITEREAQIAFASEAVGRPVTSRNELSIGEAGALIEALMRAHESGDQDDAAPAGDEPAAPLPYGEFPPGY